MPKTTLIWILIPSLFVTSCSHMLPIKENQSIEEYYKRINKECSGEDVSIVMANGSEYEGEELIILDSYTNWIDSESKERINVPTEEVKSISYTDNGFGAGDGAMIGWGILFSTVASLIMIFGAPSPGGSRHMDFSEKAGMAFGVGLIISLPGLLLGAIIGSITGSETTFEIPPSEYSFPENGASLE